jgi:serine/threonine-protein kinase
MEFLEGMPLSRRLAEHGQLEVAKTLDILRQVGDALDAAHSIDVVHRELTPEHLFLVPDAVAPGGERVKVMGFGIATMRRTDDAGEITSLTKAFPYISPEQCRSDAVDQRSVVYSLGCIAYEMLAGRPPFTADTAVGVLIGHLTLDVPPLPRPHAETTPTLELALVRSLEKDPAARFATAAQFVAALSVGATISTRRSPRQSTPPT